MNARRHSPTGNTQFFRFWSAARTGPPHRQMWPVLAVTALVWGIAFAELAYIASRFLGVR